MEIEPHGKATAEQCDLHSYVERQLEQLGEIEVSENAFAEAMRNDSSRRQPRNVPVLLERGTKRSVVVSASKCRRG